MKSPDNAIYAGDGKTLSELGVGGSLGTAAGPVTNVKGNYYRGIWFYPKGSGSCSYTVDGLTATLDYTDIDNVTKQVSSQGTKTVSFAFDGLENDPEIN